MELHRRGNTAIRSVQKFQSVKKRCTSSEQAKKSRGLNLSTCMSTMGAQVNAYE